MTAENVNTQGAEFDDELVDEASSVFPGMEDLDGRLVGIFALKKGTAEGDSGEYPFIETVTVVLDDGKDGDKVTELVGPAPQIIDFRHSTGYLVKTLDRRVNGIDQHDRPLWERPYVGRIDSQPSKRNKKVLAYAIREPEEGDRALYTKGTPGQAALVKGRDRARSLKSEVDNASAFE